MFLRQALFVISLIGIFFLFFKIESVIVPIILAIAGAVLCLAGILAVIGKFGDY